jgi:hypothetical protein
VAIIRANKANANPTKLPDRVVAFRAPDNTNQILEASPAVRATSVMKAVRVVNTTRANAPTRVPPRENRIANSSYGNLKYGTV